MPVAAVALAAGSFAAGAAAFTAAAAGSFAALAAGATMVGSALTIIGTVTGNAKLSKIGGVLAIGGMVGTGFANASAAASGAADGAAGAGLAPGDTGAMDAGIGGAADAGAATTASADAMAGAAGLPTAQTAGLATGGEAAIPGQSVAVSNSNPNSLVASAMESPVAEQTAAAPFKASSVDPFATQADPLSALNPNNVIDRQVFDASLDTGMPNAFSGKAPSLISQARALGPASTATADPSVIERFSKWAKENPDLAKYGFQTAGGLAKATLSSEKDGALADYYTVKADEERRKALWATGKTA